MYEERQTKLCKHMFRKGNSYDFVQYKRNKGLYLMKQGKKDT